MIRFDLKNAAVFHLTILSVMAIISGLSAVAHTPPKPKAPRKPPSLMATPPTFKDVIRLIRSGDRFDDRFADQGTAATCLLQTLPPLSDEQVQEFLFWVLSPRLEQRELREDYLESLRNQSISEPAIGMLKAWMLDDRGKQRNCETMRAAAAVILHMHPEDDFAIQTLKNVYAKSPSVEVRAAALVDLAWSSAKPWAIQQISAQLAEPKAQPWSDGFEEHFWKVIGLGNEAFLARLFSMIVALQPRLEEAWLEAIRPQNPRLFDLIIGGDDHGGDDHGGDGDDHGGDACDSVLRGSLIDGWFPQKNTRLH